MSVLSTKDFEAAKRLMINAIFYNGLPGTGKTYLMINAATGKDLIITQTNANSKNLLALAVKQDKPHLCI
jgi:hypothetical protein